MAVKITENCINCEACIDECPATAIVGVDMSPNDEFTYVKPEKCIECVDCSVPKCYDVCPTEGAFVWDREFTVANEEHYKNGHESGVYAIREHKKKGLMLPSVAERPFREVIGSDLRDGTTALEF